MKYLFLFFLILIGCSESKKNDSNSVAALALLSASSNCPAGTSVTSIGGSTRTQFDFTNCNPSGLPVVGFLSENLTTGLVGTGTNSRMVSLSDYKSSGSKKINMEVTFLINSASGYLDVIGNGSVSGTAITGPGFRITQSSISLITSTGGTDALTGTVPSPGAIETTYCLEIHAEGAGAHMFGWPSSCSSVTNFGTYSFEKEDVTTANPGSRIGFVLNNATLKKLIVSQSLGTAGSIQE